ncbi:MAG: monovalent cation/H+ antiporter complex subunit F [Thermoplasmatota archaeon]
MIDFANPIFIAIGVFSIYIIISIFRIFLGPTAADRIVALDTINTLVIAAMVGLSAATLEVLFVDIAIVYAILSFVSTLFIAKYLEGGSSK